MSCMRLLMSCIDGTVITGAVCLQSRRTEGGKIMLIIRIIMISESVNYYIQIAYSPSACFKKIAYKIHKSFLMFFYM